MTAQENQTHLDSFFDGTLDAWPHLTQDHDFNIINPANWELEELDDLHRNYQGGHAMDDIDVLYELESEVGKNEN